MSDSSTPDDSDKTRDKWNLPADEDGNTAVHDVGYAVAACGFFTLLAGAGVAFGLPALPLLIAGGAALVGGFAIAMYADYRTPGAFVEESDTYDPAEGEYADPDSVTVADEGGDSGE